MERYTAEQWFLIELGLYVIAMIFVAIGILFFIEEHLIPTVKYYWNLYFGSGDMMDVQTSYHDPCGYCTDLKGHLVYHTMKTPHVDSFYYNAE